MIPLLRLPVGIKGYAEVFSLLFEEGLGGREIGFTELFYELPFKNQNAFFFTIPYFVLFTNEGTHFLAEYSIIDLDGYA